MDKQKQIEEMAKAMKKAYEKYGLLNFRWFAESVYDLGYRKKKAGEVVLSFEEYEELEKNQYKIPEGAVVLTEEAYSDLLSDEVDTIERDIAEYWATQDVKSVAKELYKEGYRKIDDHAILVLRKAKCLEQKTRKETAEKFAEKLKAKLIKVDIGEGKYLAYVCEHDIDEIYKEIIGENNGN